MKKPVYLKLTDKVAVTIVTCEEVVQDVGLRFT